MANMIWYQKMSDVKKSALWALISIPMSFVVIFLNWVFERGDILTFTFMPSYFALAIYATVGGGWSTELLWMMPVFGSVTQYLGYFLFIYLLLKILRKLKITGEPSIAKEESEKDPPTHLP